MSSYGYDAQNDELNIISGTPQQLINEALGKATGAIGNEADAFDETRTSSNPYLVGDYVIYNNTMYECNTQHYGAWNASHFTQTKIGDVLTTVNSALTQKADTSTITGFGFTHYANATSLWHIINGRVKSNGTPYIFTASNIGDHSSVGLAIGISMLYTPQSSAARTVLIGFGTNSGVYLLQTNMTTKETVIVKAFT